MSQFLPICRRDLAERGITTLDFILLNADAYVDHPSFGPAIIARMVESQGHTIGMIPQPDVHRDEDFMELGKPRYAFLVSSGNIDSMVAHYTVAKKPRSDDPYSPGNKAGRRPDRVTDVYCRKLRELYPDVPIITGGMESSLRRFAHYDYWLDEVIPSSLYTSGADILIYGMGEHQICEITNRLRAGEPIGSIRDVRGTCILAETPPTIRDAVSIASYEKVKSDKSAYLRAFSAQMQEQCARTGRTIIQKHGDRFLVQNPPSPPLSQAELDAVFSLPYTREPHPIYRDLGEIKAIEEVRFSLNHNRGCFGGCNFCAITSHQGREVTCRSVENVLEEARALLNHPEFKGYFSDVGGPTANFRIPACKKQILGQGVCTDRRCLAPSPCPNLVVSHKEYIELLRQLRALPGVKKVFIRSGLRYDYMLLDKDPSIIEEITVHHVSGQLRVAPEHCSAAVLQKMGKPPISKYQEFVARFQKISKKIGKEQYVVPYLMSSHPGSTLRDAVELAVFLKKNHIRPEQVQDFYPTPGTVSTCMYYTGIDPTTGEAVYVAKDPHEKRLQRALLQYYDPKFKPLVREALRRAGRGDLIGYGGDCLVEPEEGQRRNKQGDPISIKQRSGTLQPHHGKRHSEAKRGKGVKDGGKKKKT